MMIPSGDSNRPPRCPDPRESGRRSPEGFVLTTGPCLPRQRENIVGNDEEMCFGGRLSFPLLATCDMLFSPKQAGRQGTESRPEVKPPPKTKSFQTHSCCSPKIILRARAVFNTYHFVICNNDKRCCLRLEQCEFLEKMGVDMGVETFIGLVYGGSGGQTRFFPPCVYIN